MAKVGLCLRRSDLVGKVCATALKDFDEQAKNSGVVEYAEWTVADSVMVYRMNPVYLFWMERKKLIPVHESPDIPRSACHYPSVPRPTTPRERRALAKR
jgi:hypothetical protein